MEDVVRIMPEHADRRADAVRAKAAPALPSKFVVVHAGARDRYQVALALSRAGLLECLVTDFFWSEETPFRRWLAQRLPARVLAVLRQRSAPGLPPSQVRLCLSAGIGGFLLDKARRVPFRLRRWYTRASDARLGRLAGRIARRTGAELLSYSYYGFDAFRAAGKSGVLFQMHPHPQTMRSILRDEMQRQPDCVASLEQEWELNLPEEDFNRLAAEPATASEVLAASSFTRMSLVANGVSPEQIRVVPYGIDLDSFHPDTRIERSPRAPLKLLFVGRINQRKGIKYLLEALALLPDAALELTVCGRIIDGLSLFEEAGPRVRVLPSVSAEVLLEQYQRADMLVLPSIGEGFGQVLLEALACGLPILATTHTAAPDLIREAREGFIVEPRRPDQIADRIRWALEHRAELLAMRSAARLCAERFPWSAFEREVSQSARGYLAARGSRTEEVA